MDTYWSRSGDCIKCGRCVTACENDGYGHLVGGRGHTPTTYDDNLCCHRCSQPCKTACHYGKIKITRC